MSSFDTDGNFTWWNGTSTSSNFTATTSTDDSYSGNILSLTTNSTWIFDDYTQWPKGVQDPSTEFKYTPKWHIIQGYKAQMKKMWN